MTDNVTLTIDGVEVEVPKGTVIVDAAKRVNNDIPVFCYHPKMKPVGMCRMCLVEVGMPMRDRATGELVLEEDGSPKINFGRGLQTGCTVQVADGMVVRTKTEPVTEARDDIIEFLLTSHPLDCPICDKGGECPLQNLTMRHGPGTSRFDYSQKMKLDKHVPLGDLIYLDRERCIQCGRCTRFQDEIADDPVIAFHNRGRRLEIVTLSEPGFDSYWSGNTTDICPVGALTTADFRFGARPWELTPVASICPHCPVGCNTTMSTRREAKSDGRTVIKRIMPRQNESVNEIWICDKGRFVHHFADSSERLTKPLIRRNGILEEAGWEQALATIARNLEPAGSAAAGLVGDQLSNEDLFLFQKLFRQGLNSNNLDLANKRLAGGDVAAQVGIASGSNLKELGNGDAILVVASDLHEEAPVWWLRVKQAAERGAAVIVMNIRQTRLDEHATYTLYYGAGQALTSVHKLLNAAKVDTGFDAKDNFHEVAETLINAQNLVIFYGYEGLTYDETETLSHILANYLLLKGEDSHAGQKNSGLIPVWPGGNTQGAWDMGLRPTSGPGYSVVDNPGMNAEAIYNGLFDGQVKALYLLGADPVGDGLVADRGQLDFLVVQDMFLTDSGKLADVVLPAQSWAEREGTFTNGERRVQRFYPAIPAVGQSRADWQILAQLGERMGQGKAPYAASMIFRDISQAVPQYSEMTYRTLARSEAQWPKVGGDDLYYGGNAYDNRSGLGQQWAATAESQSVEGYEIPATPDTGGEALVAVQAAALYQPGTLVDKSDVIASRVAQPAIFIHTDDATRLSVSDGDTVTMRVNGMPVEGQAQVNGKTAAGTILLRGTKTVPGNGLIAVEDIQVKE